MSQGRLWRKKLIAKKAAVAKQLNGSRISKEALSMDQVAQGQKAPALDSGKIPEVEKLSSRLRPEQLHPQRSFPSANFRKNVQSVNDRCVDGTDQISVENSRAVTFSTETAGRPPSAPFV